MNSFKYWKVIKNKFPYDQVTEKHDLIVFVRHVEEDGLNKEEIRELKYIKESFAIKENYNYILETTKTT